MTAAASSPLEGIRVLDLATTRAELAGRLLADLGAGVLKVEPPGGCDARRVPPLDERTGVSLYWASVAAGKRSAVLDLETEASRTTLRRLVAAADILIESFDPGYLDALGFGWPALAHDNPRLVYVSVTPYGQQGPKAGWPATDLTLEAASGRLGMQGDRDRPPLPIGYPQASFHAGARAAADALIALNERELSGAGQHLDLSMQEAMVITLMNLPGYPPNMGADPPGSGDDRGEPAAIPPGPLGRCECRDGHVIVTPTSQKQMLAALPVSVLPALAERGEMPAAFRDLDAGAWQADVAEGRLSQERLAEAVAAVRAFFKLKTKRELMEWAWDADVHLGPVNSVRDLLANPHFRERGYWQKVGPYIQPSRPARFSRSNLAPLRPAPALGADQALLDGWQDQRATAQPTVVAQRLGEAFTGLKVVDFSWVAVGPLTAKALADHGATVVRVESSTRVDYLRTLQPFKDGIVGVNRSHYMNNCNTSKLGVALNLRTPAGLQLARRLVAWADVVVENFTPGTMARLGLGYETLSKDRPDLIMLSTCLLGQTGPWASFAGYGPHGAGIAGLYGVTGWPDRAPSGPNGPYTDVIAPHYTISALAAAILERRRSGLGQHIDVSQVEAAVHFLEPLVLDETVNGRNAGPAGLSSPTACPNGVYATAGRERYIAIAVETEQHWQALLSVAPLAAFSEPRFAEAAERRRCNAEIDAVLQVWAREHDGFELERRLCRAGVPAAAVQRMTDLHADAQLKARGFFVPLKHSEVGEIPYDGLPTRFSAKQRMLHKAAPCVGEDNDYVMREILGLSEDEITDYAAAGVFE
jgi:crotonobetainyl-CoA:carnitine CoA-transferase CaiB-like acyl-CoA transferase